MARKLELLYFHNLINRWACILNNSIAKRYF